MQLFNYILFLFSFVNCDLDHSHNDGHSVSDGHSSQHSYKISHSDTGFNIEYIGYSVVENYQIFTNFENEIENRFILDKTNYTYNIINYANNIEVHDSFDHRLECLYYSKLPNGLNYTILNYNNVSFHSALLHINSDYSYCLKKDIHEEHEQHKNNNNVLLYPIMIILLCILIVVLVIVSISCGIMRHRAIAHIHTFTRNPVNACTNTNTNAKPNANTGVNAKQGINVEQLEIGESQTLEHIH